MFVSFFVESPTISQSRTTLDMSDILLRLLNNSLVPSWTTANKVKRIIYFRLRRT